MSRAQVTITLELEGEPEDLVPSIEGLRESLTVYCLTRHRRVKIVKPISISTKNEYTEFPQ